MICITPFVALAGFSCNCGKIITNLLLEKALDQKGPTIYLLGAQTTRATTRTTFHELVRQQPHGEKRSRGRPKSRAGVEHQTSRVTKTTKAHKKRPGFFEVIGGATNKFYVSLHATTMGPKQRSHGTRYQATIL